MLQYVIYCRKSSESEERQVLSIESQIKELQEFAERLNLTVSETLTESYSAKRPGRPVFNGMMQKVYKGQLKGIIAWKLDRLARNPIDGGSLVWALNEGKISEIVTPHGTFQNSSDNKLMMQIEFGMAKKYVDDLSDNVKRGNRAKLERGWVPGPLPLGYLHDPKERITIIDPDRFHLIRRIWDLCLQGVSPRAIQKIANEEWGFRTRPCKRQGNKPLGLNTLYNMFGNPFYYGLIERKEGVFAGKHEPMITADEYWRVQEILGRKGRPRPKRHKFAFTGMIRCGECGGMITAEEKTKKNDRHYVYYRCSKKKANTVCHQKYLNLKVLETQIIDYLGKIHVPEELFDIGVEYLDNKMKEERRTFQDTRKPLENALANCQKKLSGLNSMRIGGLIDDEEYIFEKKKLLEEKLGLETRLKDGNANENQPFEWTMKTLDFARHARERFQISPPERKRTIFQEIGSDFFLKDKKLLIEAKKPLLILEEGLKKVHSDFVPLEPLVFPSIEPRKGLSPTQIQSWWALVEDVRTHYEKAATKTI